MFCEKADSSRDVCSLLILMLDASLKMTRLKSHWLTARHMVNGSMAGSSDSLNCRRANTLFTHTHQFYVDNVHLDTPKRNCDSSSHRWQSPESNRSDPWEPIPRLQLSLRSRDCSLIISLNSSPRSQTHLLMQYEKNSLHLLAVQLGQNIISWIPDLLPVVRFHLHFQLSTMMN